MIRWTFALPVAAIALAGFGCSGDYEVAPAYDSSLLAPTGEQAPEPAEQAAAEQSRTGQASSSASGSPASGERGASQEAPIRLSAGVALAQSLPTGTAMGFSVDYRFTGGEANSTISYVWVIRPAKGDPARQEVQLGDQGTLQNFFPQFRPENGPFSTHIEDGNGTQLSRSLPLR